MTSDKEKIPSFQPDSRLIDWMQEIRRTVHQYPELAYNEHRTGKLITEKLQELDIPFRTGLARTGILGFIEPKDSGSTGVDHR